MARATRSRVLLISRVPELHHDIIRSYRSHGFDVFAARSGARATSLFHRSSPTVVLVDLAMGSCLTPLLVRTLNERRDALQVVALHHGGLEAVGGPANDLNVHGFFRLGELESVAGANPSPVSPSYAIH